MKTVKFSLNELMSEIDESFIEEVYFHDCNKILKKYSKQKIRQNVFCKTASKHKPLKFTYRTAIIVTVVSVFLCMPVYAAIGYVYCDDRVAFVLNIFLERFVNDTVDYHIHYVGVDSLDEECIECRKYSDYCEHILPAFWIDDDFCE